jgi:N-acetyl-1-D-myo-inositol-2-amino-2-deoxy-alpha-D-glucopyranoside deacetylase
MTLARDDVLSALVSNLACMTLTDRRILLVHAHPDDESIGNGATMAKYAAEGVQVTLVTCTAGEEGEILTPEIAHLAADQEDGLGPHRIEELAAAMKALGVTDHRFLGGPGHFRDSGMKWADDGSATVADETRPDTFWHADLTVAADLLVEIIREIRPQVLVTYDQFGGYGHPDHIQAHRVATYAAALAAVRSYRPDLGEEWDIPKVYWDAMSKSQMAEGIRKLREAGDEVSFEGWDPDNLPWGQTDEELDAKVEADEHAEAKMDAMKAHASQIAIDGPFFALSNNAGSEVWGTEFYRLAKGERGPVGPDGLEEDLFAGL